MENENLQYRPTWEDINHIGPQRLIFENDDIEVRVLGDCVCIGVKAFKKYFGDEDFEIDTTKIRQLYNSQGNKITLNDILNNITQQYKIYEGEPMRQFILYD